MNDRPTLLDPSFTRGRSRNAGRLRARAETSPPSPAVSVVIPSYGRPAALADAVASLAEGDLRPNELILVGHSGDDKTAAAMQYLAERFGGSFVVRLGFVTALGHQPPVQCGFRLAAGDLVALIDDDVTVRRDWLRALVQVFDDPRIGVAGGPAIDSKSRSSSPRGRPGCISWYGRLWGNIHAVVDGPPRLVDTVPEGNSAWRREVIEILEFDPELNRDAAFLYGADLTLQAKRAGWQVVFVPAAQVDHHHAPRHAGLDRQRLLPRAEAYAFNYSYMAAKHLGGVRLSAFALWWFLLGEAMMPGPLRLGWGRFQGSRIGWKHLLAATRGKIDGWRAAKRAGRFP